MKNILFICSQNKLRSPTAEEIFSIYPEVEARSAGTNNDAVIPLSGDDVEWADLIFCMEEIHRRKLRERFRDLSQNKRILVLEIPDDYGYMDSELIGLLKAKVERWL